MRACNGRKKLQDRMRMPGWRWHALRKKSQKICRIFNLQNCILLVSQNVNDMKDLVSSKRSSNAWGSYQDQNPNTTMLLPENGTRMSNASPSCRIIVEQRQQNSLKTYQTDVVLSVVLSFFFQCAAGKGIPTDGGGMPLMPMRWWLRHGRRWGHSLAIACVNL